MGCILLVAVTLLSACATTDSQLQRDGLQKALLAAGDADSVTAAGLLANNSSRLNLFQQAFRAVPDRPGLAWLLLQECLQDLTCDPQPFEERLRSLDSKNGAVWVGSIARAAKAGETLAVQAYIAEIGNAERFDLYWNTSVVHIANALVRTRRVANAQIHSMAIGMLATTTLPAYKDIVAACKRELLQQPEAVANCRRASTVMRNSDAYITEMIGMAIAARAWPEGNAEHEEAIEAHRVANYRMCRYGKLGERGKLARILNLYASQRREQDVILARLIDAGVDPNPPADWKDPVPLPP